MIEEYVLNELKSLKEENKNLKEQLTIEQNQPLKLITDKVFYIELVGKDIVIKKLEENRINPIQLLEEKGFDDYTKIIKEYDLYVERKPKNSDVIGHCKFNNKYYEMEKYYNEFKITEQVFINLDEAIYYELTDKFYDYLVSYRNEKKKAEQEASKEVNE